MSKEQIMKYSVIGLILLAIIIALTVILWPKAPDTSAGMGLTVDPYSGSFVQPEKAEEDTESTGGIAIPGWGSIHIQAGEKLVDVNLENPIDNEGKYYLSFSVYLKGEDKACIRRRETTVEPFKSDTPTAEIRHSFRWSDSWGCKRGDRLICQPPRRLT